MDVAVRTYFFSTEGSAASDTFRLVLGQTDLLLFVVGRRSALLLVLGADLLLLMLFYLIIMVAFVVPLDLFLCSKGLGLLLLHCPAPPRAA